MSAVEPIFQDVERVFETLRRHLPHHQPASTDNGPGAAQNTTITEDPLSVITDVKAGLHDVVARLEQVDEAAASKLEQLQANPGAMQVVDAALAAVHLPPEAFTIVVRTLADLEGLYNVPDPSAAAAPAPAPAA